MGLLDIRPTKFGGVGILDRGAAAISQDLLVDSADAFAKSDLDLGRCNIIKHAIKITDPHHLKNIIKGSHLTSMRR